MLISKRFFFSTIILFSLIWGSLNRYLNVVEKAKAGYDCVLISNRNYPKYFLNAKTGKYLVFPDAEWTKSAPWAREVSPDKKYIAYLQPSLDNPFGMIFDLYVEELATGKRSLVKEKATKTPLHDGAELFALLWSKDSQFGVFADQPLGTIETPIIFDTEGQVLETWTAYINSFRSHEIVHADANTGTVTKVPLGDLLAERTRDKSMLFWQRTIRDQNGSATIYDSTPDSNLSYQYTQEIVYPFWRYQQVQADIRVWEDQGQIYSEVHDLTSGHIYAHQMPFSNVRNVTLTQIYSSSLTLYSFEENLITHLGVYDPYTGEIILQFSGDRATLPEFVQYPDYFGSTFESQYTFAFAYGNETDYYNTQGEHLLHLSQRETVWDSPDERTLGGLRFAGSGVEVWLYNTRMQQTDHYKLAEPPRYRGYLLQWSPKSDYALIETHEYLAVYNRTGHFLWQFPHAEFLDRYGQPNFDWVRCDIFLRWGKIRVIEHGYADKP